MPSRDKTPSRDELAAVCTTPRPGSASDAQPAVATIASSPAASPHFRISITPPPARAPEFTIRVRANGPTGLKQQAFCHAGYAHEVAALPRGAKFRAGNSATAHRISEIE